MALGNETDTGVDSHVARAAKRRRLDQAYTTLKKPFISPLKSSLASRTNQSERPNHGPPSLDPACNTPKRDIMNRSPITTPTRPTLRVRSAASVNKQLSSKPEDAQIASLLGQQRELELQLRILRQAVDTVTEAHRIASSRKDDELRDLSAKWRAASRSAAEQVFCNARDRVNKMGGMGAWRERERDKMVKLEEWRTAPIDQDPGGDDDCEFDSQGEELSEREKEFRRKRKAEVLEEKRAALEPQEEDWHHTDGAAERERMNLAFEGQDDDSYTMDTMLRSLNIDLDLVGFDPETQRWIDVD